MNQNKQAKSMVKVDTKVLDSRATKIVYWIFQSFMIGTLLAAIILCIVRPEEREIQITHIFLCSVALILYQIPSFLKKRFHVYIPTVLQVFTLIFIYAHFILGEISGVYTTSLIFDKILHTTSGLAIATIGFSLVNILNTSKNTHLQLSPLFVALFAFCFALAVAVVWEIFEFGADSLLGMNMQRYDPPANLVSGEPPIQGYGLIDTMGDIIVSTIAAFVVCLIGFLSLKSKKNYMNMFLLRMVPNYDSAIEEATLAGDEKLVAHLQKAKAESLKCATVTDGATEDSNAEDVDKNDSAVDVDKIDSAEDVDKSDSAASVDKNDNAADVTANSSDN